MSESPPGVPTISARDAAAATADPNGPLIVDVRELDEFASERIDGAVLVPISSFTTRHEELPRDRPLLMICHAGSRSMSATMFLTQRGWPDVRNVEGGMLAWMRDGLPVRTGPPDPGEGDLPG
jgi:rhodanese-related sulfurtransferase